MFGALHPGACLEPCQIFVITLFCENDQRLLTVNYFSTKTQCKCLAGSKILLCSLQLILVTAANTFANISLNLFLILGFFQP